MRILLVGGGVSIEMVYFLARDFSARGDRVTIVNPHPAEAQMLSRRVKATVILGDGSDPRTLEEAGARRADVVISLLPADPDNLATCQIAARLFGVPRTIALVNDPDNEPIFRQLGITEIFSTTRVLGSLIEGKTLYDEITHLFPADEGRRYVTEVVLDRESPGSGKNLIEIDLPRESLVACVIRDGEIIVPSGDRELRAGDRLIVITLPEHHRAALRALAGEAD
ncbi:MAG TPA: TrkA family potassium uptake protein [Anaerolineae bacterium]|nr:TrkA family potassium uptake protein [Anaerolineae bacterium]